MSHLCDWDFSEYLRDPKNYPLYGGIPLNKETAERGKASAKRLLHNLYKAGALIPINE